MIKQVNATDNSLKGFDIRNIINFIQKTRGRLPSNMIDHFPRAKSNPLHYLSGFGSSNSPPIPPNPYVWASN